MQKAPRKSNYPALWRIPLQEGPKRASQTGRRQTQVSLLPERAHATLRGLSQRQTHAEDD